MPAMSFTRLLAHMATIVRNTMRSASARIGEATFTLTTRPNPKRQQALTSWPPSPCRQDQGRPFDLNSLKQRQYPARLAGNFGLEPKCDRSFQAGDRQAPVSRCGLAP